MTYNHEHEFEYEPSRVEVDETIAVYHRCTYAPVYGSTYSERHDEMFYDEGPRCDATQITYFYPTEVWILGEDGQRLLRIWDLEGGDVEGFTAKLDEVFMKGEEYVEDDPFEHGVDHRASDLRVEVPIEETTYELYYGEKDVEVRY